MILFLVLFAVLAVEGASQKYEVRYEYANLKINPDYGKVHSYDLIDGTLTANASLIKDIPTTKTKAYTVLYKRNSRGNYMKIMNKLPIGLCKAIESEKKRVQYGFEVYGLSRVIPAVTRCPITKGDYTLTAYAPNIDHLPSTRSGYYKAKTYWDHSNSHHVTIMEWTTRYEVYKSPIANIETDNN